MYVCIYMYACGVNSKLPDPEKKAAREGLPVVWVEENLD